MADEVRGNAAMGIILAVLLVATSILVMVVYEVRQDIKRLETKVQQLEERK